MGQARLPSRTPLLLSEMDAALRHAERAAANGDTQDVARHYAAHVRAGREPREFFHKELDDFHRASAAHHQALDDWMGDDQIHTDARRRAAELARINDMRKTAEHAAKRLGAKGHTVGVPVGQFLDRTRLSRRSGVDFERALHHVSHPHSTPRFGHGPLLTSDRRRTVFNNSDEESARHLEHSLRHHFPNRKMSREKGVPTNVELDHPDQPS